MIGQTNLLKLIEEQIEFEDFPRFSIIVGAEGSGKKTITLSIAYALNCQRVFIEPKVDSIREMIKNCYSVNTPTMYVIFDSDKMSQQAKNAMLKVCEETPDNAYIVMLVNDIETVLPTIKSRASIYYMEPYTPEELLEYASVTDEKQKDIIMDLCETPGDVEKLRFTGIYEFYDFVEKVVDNIAEVSDANALKIAGQIDFKDNDAQKYDMVLFLRAFKSVCGKRMKKAVAEDDMEMQLYYSAGIKIVTKALRQMQITGINKSALFDMFILDIRREWC